MSTKMRLALGLVAAVVGIMAMSAAPAGAWFRSLNQAKTQGQVKLGVTTLATGGATVTCQNAFGEWKIQTEGNWWEHEVNGKQLKTIEGPHLYLQIKQWNNCKAEVSLLKTEAKVLACEFQLEQPNKLETKSTATVVSECVISIPAAKCQIGVPPGTHTGGNEGLKEVKGETNKQAQSVLATAAVTGIHGEGCGEKFENAKFTSAEGSLRAIGLELV